uniref:Uncharacterized protein n=1 Tax=Glossina brevipalpis TaxID=37001 RepID=A0A1A9WSY2_9MUSC
MAECLLQTSSDNVIDLVQINKQRLQNIIQRLNWSDVKILNSFNNNSQAAEIKQKTIKYSKISTFPESYEWKNSVNLRTPQLQELLKNFNVKAPINFAELQLNFSREEKLKIYQYVIENTLKVEEIVPIERNHGEISLAEIVAAKRREKRKKRRYRTSKPTHTEEVRALVDLQMQALQQYLGQKKRGHNVQELQIHKNRGIRQSKKSDKYEERVKRSTFREHDKNTRDRDRSYKRGHTSKRSENDESGRAEPSKKQSKNQYERSYSREHKRSFRKSRSHNKTSEIPHTRRSSQGSSSTNERKYSKSSRNQSEQQNDDYKKRHKK